MAEKSDVGCVNFDDCKTSDAVWIMSCDVDAEDVCLLARHWSQ